MFKSNKGQYNPDYYENMQINRIYYEFEEINRKLRNLNNRLHRIELFLGLSIDDNKGDK